MKISLAFLFVIVMNWDSCNGQVPVSSQGKSHGTPTSIIGDKVLQIGNNIRCIFQDKQKTMWFSTDGEGVFRYDGKTILQINKKHGLCSNAIDRIEQSADGTMLFSSNNDVCKFDGNTFSTVKSSETSANIDNSDSILLAGYYYQNEKLKQFQLPPTSRLTKSYSQNPYAVYCSFKDRKGNIWFGTESRGVCKYDGQSFTWLDNEELGLAVRAIFEDQKGNIWIGNNGHGLFRYDGKVLTNITKEYKLENSDFQTSLQGKPGTLARAWAITEDNGNNLWIGTIDAGLWKFDGNRFANFTTKDGLSGDSIWTLYVDSKGVLWIGTSDHGVTKFDEKKFSKFEVGK